MYQLTLLRRAAKDLDALSQSNKIRVNEVFGGLLMDPYIGKKLHGVLLGCYALRVLPYRIVYIVDKAQKRILTRRAGLLRRSIFSQ